MLNRNYYKLSEVCHQICDGVHNTVIDAPDGEFYLLSAKNIKNGRVTISDNERKISAETFNKLRKRTRTSKGDLLLTTVGASIGDTAIIEDINPNYEFQRSVGIFKPNQDLVVPEYLLYVFQSESFQQYLYNNATGAAQPCLFLGFLNNIKISLPELEIQKTIVNIISNYDKLIDNNNKRIKILEQMAENLYKEWFVRFRFPGHEDAEFEDGLPKEWLKTELESVLSKITTGLNPRSNFSLGEGENYYVTIKNMGDNNIFLDDKCDRVNDEAIIKINKRSDLQRGDILFSGIGTIGRTYLVCIPTDNWNVSESVFTLRANDKITKEYLYMLLLSDDVQNYCNQHAQGVAQKGIRMGELKSMKISLPPRELIVRFTEIVEPIIMNQQILRREIVNITKQRDLLLPRLMCGKLQVK